MKRAIVVMSFTAAFVLSARAALFGPFTDHFADIGAGPGGIVPGSAIALTDVRNLSGQGLGSQITDVILTVNLSSSDGVASILGMLRLGDQPSSPSLSFTPTSGSFTLDVTSTFSGFNPNDNWSLSFANPKGSFENSLTGWSLDITAVPEPINVALGVFGVVAVGAGVAGWYWKRRKVQRRAYIWPV